MSEKKDFFKKDFISINDYSTEQVNYILKNAEKIQKNPEKYNQKMSGKIMMPLFFENSSRTTLSFQTAMIKMNGVCLDFDLERSSIKKGETLKDTIKTIEQYEPDVIVIRHKKDGAAKLAADTTYIPVINAGDGKNQHPTQTLLDLYTIKQVRGELDNTQITIAGDLKYGRCPHSLAIALSRYKNIYINFVSPETLKMPKDLLKNLKEKKVIYKECELKELEKAIKKSDILYMTRIQRERFPKGIEGESEYEKISKTYCLKPEMLKGVKETLKIMHPLPKVFEIHPEIDKGKHAHYFTQAKNGVYVRKSLLDLILWKNKE